MAAALFDFCLILLLLGFFLYGLREWDHLLADPEDEHRGKPGGAVEPLPAGRKIAIWVLVAGLGLVALATDLLSWWRGE